MVEKCKYTPPLKPYNLCYCLIIACLDSIFMYDIILMLYHIWLDWVILGTDDMVYYVK